MLHRHGAILIATISVIAAACGPSATAQDPSSGPTAGPSDATAASQVASAAPPATPATTSAPPSVGTSAGALRIAQVTLRADPAESIGACPVKIVFSSTITVAGGPGSVAYRWKSSDGDTSPLKKVSFTGPGSQTVTSSWTVDASTVVTHAGWSSIEIVDPAPSSSAPAVAPATFAFTCPEDDDIEAIGLGIGGSDADCSIGKDLRTFNPTDHIRMVANFWPSLAAGTLVTVSLTRDGAPVDPYPVKVPLDVATKCVHGNVSNGSMAAGHYHLDVAPDTARGIGVDFDVR